MKIKSIKTSNVKGYLKLLVDTGDGDLCFVLSSSQYEALGSPASSCEISEDDFRILSKSDEYNRAKKRALNILAFGDNSERELILKLKRAKISHGVAEKIVAEMKQLGYINEERQLLRLVECEANTKHHGAKKIVARLVPKGYSTEKIKSAIRELEHCGKIDFAETKRKLLDGVFDEAERRKILYKNGF